jgi:putative transposase
MVAFIDQEREAYGVEPICAVLPIAPSTYYRHKALAADPSKRPARAKRDELLRGEIRRVYDAHRQVYGVCKVWRQLTRERIVAPRCAVERLMRQEGCRAWCGGVARARRLPSRPRIGRWIS